MRGLPLILGDGKEYVVAPLSLGALEDYGEQLQNFKPDAIMERDTLALVIDIAWSALKRNYPKMTRDEVRDLLDMECAPQVFAACMSASGLTPKGETSGEAKAPARKPRRR